MGIRKALQVLLLTALLYPAVVLALALDALELDSGLNEVFEARIPLVGTAPDLAGDMRVGLAADEDFRRSGIERGAVATGLKFDLVEEDGGGWYIHVTSRDRIREPVVNFVIQLDWSGGRLVREYKVLLDAPGAGDR